LRGAQASVAWARRFNRELELKELARADFTVLCRNPDLLGLRLLAIDPDEFPSDLSAEERFAAWLARTDFCVSQEGLNEALARGEPHIRVHSTQGLAFQTELTKPCLLAVLGNAHVEIVSRTSAAAICFYQRSRGRIESLSDDELLEQSLGAYVSLFQESEVMLGHATSGFCFGDSLARPESRQAKVILRERSRCLLGQAASVSANAGTAVVLGEGASCCEVEFWDYSPLEDGPGSTLLLDAVGETLLNSRDMPSDKVHQFGSVSVTRPLPF
jgi:hypothetical protein